MDIGTKKRSLNVSLMRILAQLLVMINPFFNNSEIFSTLLEIGLHSAGGMYHKEFSTFI